MKHERGNALVIIIGIILILFLVGFFTSSRAFWDTFNFKQILRLPCGLTVEDPKYGASDKVSYPVSIDGYVNGCGWNVSGSVAGSVQILDGLGQPVTNRVALSVPSDSNSAPFYFEASLVAIAPPRTDAGTMLFTSTTGLLYSMPVHF